MKKLIPFIFFTLILGCSTSKSVEYSFFIAGHVYGNPDNQANNKGLYKPLKEKIPYLNSQKNMKHGFLLGDVVWMQSLWKYTQEDIDLFEMPIHISRGNHDGKLNNFEKMFGKSYKKFFSNKDLFIILDLNLDHWNVTKEQLTFLRNALRVDGSKAKNIFVFSHQVLWYDKENFPEPAPNSLYDKSETTNYWTTIEPLLQATEKPVYVFAGDVGAFSMEKRRRKQPVEYSHYKHNGITYVTSGMGGGKRDNVVIVDVYKDSSVGFRLIHLNGDDINSLGKLEDYETINN